jgi:hypothetical protein
LSVETYYTVLGVPETASSAQIKAAFRDLVRQVHPDSVPNASPYWKRAAEEKTKEINEAYSVLSNQSKRREYDRLLAESRQEFSQATPAPPSPAPAPAPAPQPQSTGPYCSKCGAVLYGSGYCPVCQKIRTPYKGTGPKPVRAKKSFIPWPQDAKSAALLLCACVVGPAIIFGLLRIAWVAILTSFAIIAVLRWRKLFKVFPQYRFVCIGALVISVTFVFADLLYPADESAPPPALQTPQAVAAQQESMPIAGLKPQQQPSTPAGGSALAVLSNTKPTGLWNFPNSMPRVSPGVFNTDPMYGYGETKEFMGTECSWNNVDPKSKKEWERTGALPDHTFLISPEGQTCYIWNQDVDLFLAKGAVRGIPDIWNNSIVGYKRGASIGQKGHEPVTVELQPESNRIPIATPYVQANPSQPTPTPPLPNFSERQSIESVCSHAKYSVGPAAYDECVRQQLEQWAAGPKQPDLSALTYGERQSIESACSHAKYSLGPVAYNRCLELQLGQWTAGPKQPDLSALTYGERQSIEAVCSHAKYSIGPAAYNRCLGQQLEQWAAGPKEPDLSSLTYGERQSIESVCSHAKYSQGPAAYNQCLLRQMESLSR